MSFSARTGSHIGWSDAFWVALSEFVLGGFGLSAGVGAGSCAGLLSGKESRSITERHPKNGNRKVLFICLFDAESWRACCRPSTFVNRRAEPMAAPVRAITHNSSMMELVR